ncbi:MAG: hypothetical protein FWH40_04735 [Coriobacteriia bacterium]|nr:hypothetical protein [Coriobacteriia bacterium]
MGEEIIVNTDALALATESLRGIIADRSLIEGLQRDLGGALAISTGDGASAALSQGEALCASVLQLYRLFEQTAAYLQQACDRFALTDQALAQGLPAGPSEGGADNG